MACISAVVMGYPASRSLSSASEHTERIHLRELALRGESTGIPKDLRMDSAAPGHMSRALSSDASLLALAAPRVPSPFVVKVPDMAPLTKFFRSFSQNLFSLRE